MQADAARYLPLLRRIAEAGFRLQLRRQVPDPALCARLLPRHPLGCKRVLVSDDFYPAVARATVELVTDPIARITPAGVVTADGRERAVDAIVYATGFEVTGPPPYAVEGAMDRAGARRLAVRPAAQARHNEGLDRRLAGSVWAQCESWYRGRGGRVSALWPDFTFRYRRLTRRVDPRDLDLA
jgi:cation diffusion facilitator CzcD-associated flavoprotein CzcO